MSGSLIQIILSTKRFTFPLSSKMLYPLKRSNCDGNDRPCLRIRIPSSKPPPLPTAGRQRRVSSQLARVRLRPLTLFVEWTCVKTRNLIFADLPPHQPCAPSSPSTCNHHILLPLVSIDYQVEALNSEGEGNFQGQ